MGKTLRTATNDSDSLPIDAGRQDVSQRLSVSLNFSWALLGNIVYSACQWGMVVALAKLGTAGMVGRFGLALAVTAPIIMLSNLQLSTIQATDARREYLFGHYLGLRLAMLLPALTAIAVIAGCLGQRGEMALVILAVGLAKTFESVSDIFYGLFTQRELLHYVAKSMAIRGVLSLAALAAGVGLTGSVFWGTAAMAGIYGLVLLAYDSRNGKAVLARSGTDATGCIAWFPRPLWDRRRLVRLSVMALPMGTVALLSSLNTNIPRYFIDRYVGEHALGIFVPLAYIQVAGTTVVRALGYSVCSRLGSYYAGLKMAAYRNLMLKLVAAGSILSLAGVVIAWKGGRVILSVLYRPEYGAHSDTFVWLMAGSGGVYLAMFLGYGLTAARRLKVQAVLLFSASIVTTIMCALLVPRGGLNGAAVSLLIGNFVWVAGSVVVLLRVFGGGEPGSGGEPNAAIGIRDE